MTLRAALLVLLLLVFTKAIFNDGPSKYLTLSSLNEKRSVGNVYNPPLSNANFANFTAYINNVVMKCPSWKLPGLSVSVVTGQSTLYSRGFGVRDFVSNRSVDENTLFQVGSCTKAFTAALTSLLVDQGILDGFDTPIIYSSYPTLRLKERDVTERVTFRDLLAHRTGLPRHDMVWGSGQNSSVTSLLDNLQYLDFSFDFRSKFQYNNLMVATAGAIAGKLLGGQGDWETAVTKNLLKRLQMTKTRTDTASAIATGNYAFPHGLNAQGDIQAFQRDINKILSLSAPSGAICSSAKDMAKWLQFHLNGGRVNGNQVISEENLQENYVSSNTFPDIFSMPAPIFPAPATSTNYGMGWMTGSYRGYPMIWHDGEVVGSSAFSAFFPTANLGIFVATNTVPANINSLFEIAFAAFDTALGYPQWLDASNTCDFPCSFVQCGQNQQTKRSEKQPRDTNTFIASEYIGNYSHPSYGSIQITANSDTLFFSWGLFSGYLGNFGQDVFIAALDSPVFLEAPTLPIQFSRNWEGIVDSISLPLDPNLPPIPFVNEAHYPKLCNPNVGPRNPLE